MRWSLIVIVLFAAPFARAEGDRTPLLILDFKHDDAHERTARVINEVVATAASKTDRFSVTTGTDLAQAMDLESEKAAMGCGTEASSCLAEIAGAMGAELVLFGDVGTLGDTTLVSLNLFDNNSASSVGRETVKAAKLDDLPILVEHATERLLRKRAGGEVREGPPLMTLGLGTTTAGAAVLISGLSLAGLANLTLEEPSSSKADKDLALGYGLPSFWIGLVGGSALIVGGAAMTTMRAME